MKVLVYLQEDMLAPKGGPLAVGYYYNCERKNRNDKTIEFLKGGKSNHSKLDKIESILKVVLPKSLWDYYKEYRRTIAFRHLLEDSPKPIDINLNEYDIVHFHQADHMYRARLALESYKGIVVYQPHSPIPYGQELYVHMPQRIQNRISDMQNKLEAMDRYCFERADYIIFPCPEAEEPYADNWKFFNEIKKQKASCFKYVLTGILPCSPKRTREEVFNELGISSDSFLISYVGRHNHVKGFDILKEIASSYFEKNDNAHVVSAGVEDPYTRLEHERWHEIGFTNDAHSYISASDVFVLPNRVTYFDIVMIEVLSLGKLVVASRTGGNKLFEKNNVPGIFLYDTKEEAVDLLEKIHNMSNEQRLQLGELNRQFYRDYLSVPAMYDSYIRTLGSLIEESKHV